MEVTNIEKILSKIEKNISGHRPGLAIKALKKVLSEQKLWKFSAALQQIESRYNSMIEYMMKGGEDPARGEFVEDITSRLRQLTDSVRREVASKDSPEIYYSEIRMFSIRENNIASLITQFLMSSDDTNSKPEKENLLNSIFNLVWTTFPFDEGNLKLLSQTASDESTPQALRSQIVSALMLGSLKFYDKGRISSLLEIYNNSISLSIRAESLIALIISLYANAKRVKEDRNLITHLTDWGNDNTNKKHIEIAIMEIIRVLDTARINRTIKDDFIPAVTKLKPGIDRLFKEGKGINPEGELNPEWEEMMASSGLNDKIRELTELQEEGADLMMFAFSNLKSFSFFQNVSNWFLPFDSNHSSIASQEVFPSGLLTMLDTPGMMCDSDKYSFVFSIAHTPEAQKKMLLSQMQLQEGQMKEALAEASLKQSDSATIYRQESRRYIRNLNRFFKLFRSHNQFVDVLKHPFSIGEIPVIGEVALSDFEQLRIIGEFYLRRGYYEDATGMFRQMERIDGTDSSVLEKIGFCLEHTDNYNEALTEYRKAEFFNPDSQWLIRHIARAAKLSGKFEDAEEYYSKALHHSPDNVALIMNMANCKIKLGKKDEALKLYYKASYLEPQNINALRAIAWVEFQNGNYEKSITYHQKILQSSEVTINDYINAGHAYFGSGQIKEASELYIRGVKVSDNILETLKEFVKIMNLDRQILLESGIGITELEIMIDYVITSF